MQPRARHEPRSHVKLATTKTAPEPVPITILLVEDEPEIRELLTFTFERAGFETLAAPTAEFALQKLDDALPSIAIIDWTLPGMSGLDLAYLLRNRPDTTQLPIVMLTARGEEADKLKSFASGVDDYVTKPFSPKELTARIKALLRRAGVVSEAVASVGSISLDQVRHRVTLAGEEVHLGPREYRLLSFLMNHPERTFSRQQLLDHVWGRDTFLDERTVDVHILRIRKVLKRRDAEAHLQTVRGFGYRFSAEI
jgi:two-component system phosphate regulon response regulator PhoB